MSNQFEEKRKKFIPLYVLQATNMKTECATRHLYLNVDGCFSFLLILSSPGHSVYA